MKKHLFLLIAILASVFFLSSCKKEVEQVATPYAIYLGPMISDGCPEAREQMQAMKLELSGINLFEPVEKIIKNIEVLEYHYRNKHVTTTINLFQGNREVREWKVVAHKPVQD